MQVYTPLPPSHTPQQDHLSRRIAPKTTRLRTLSASSDSRLAIATQANISVLSPRKTLSHLYRPLPQTATLDKVLRITQSVRAPAVGHEVVYSKPCDTGRKDTLLASADIVSLSWCRDGIIFVCGRGGVYRVECGGVWGGTMGTPNAIFVQVKDATLEDTGFISDVLCVKYFLFGIEELLVVGRKSGVEIYVMGKEKTEELEWRGRIRHGYVLTVDTAENVNEEKALLAAGGDGVVTVHEVSNGGWEARLLWKMEEVRRLQQVNCVAFTTGTLRAEVCLAVAASNGFVVVDFIDGRVVGEHAVEEAHRVPQFVSSVVVCVDGSIVTGGLDGDILRWTLQTSIRENRRTAGSETIQTAGRREELVKSVVGTTNGFGVFGLTSSRRGNQEIRDVEDATSPKFAPSGRRTMISLYIMPMVDVNLVESAIVCVLDKYEMPAYYNKTACLWDVELFLADYDCDGTGLIDRLVERFFDMVKVHDEREGEAMGYYQRAKVMILLGRLILRASRDGNSENIKRVSSVRNELRNSLLCAHYDNSLSNFLHSGNVEQTSALERQVLECMCQFVSVCKARFILNSADMKSRVVEIRDRLTPFIEAGESMSTPCPVCATGMPLVADAEELATFYCGLGDAFTRCVRTGLPVTGVLPLVCPACDSRATTMKPFDWLSSQNCAICNSVLQQSSGEPF